MLKPFTRSQRAALLGGILAGSLFSGQSATLVWTNTVTGGSGGLGADFSNVGNWDPNQAPANGDILEFLGTPNTAAQPNNNMIGLQIAEIHFTQGNWDLNGNEITLGAGGMSRNNGGASPIDINTPLVINSPTIISNSRSVNQFSLNQPISGSGGLEVWRSSETSGYTDNGDVRLNSGTGNNYMGNTRVFGRLRLNQQDQIPNGAGFGNVLLLPQDASNLGVLDMNGKSDTINGLSGTGSVVNKVIANGALTVGDNDASSTFDGLLEDNVDLVKTGSGTLTLNGANTFSGFTRIDGGTIVLGNANALQNSSFNTEGPGTLNFGVLTSLPLGGLTGTFGNFDIPPGVTVILGRNDDSTDTLGGNLTGSGALHKNGTSAMLFEGANTFSGTITVESGTLGLNSYHAGTGPVVVHDGAAFTANSDFFMLSQTVNVTALSLGTNTGCDLNLIISTNIPVQTALNVTTLSTKGTVPINITASPGQDLLEGSTFPLISWSGAVGGDGSGAFVLGTLPPGVNAHLQVNANSIDLVIDTLAQTIAWSGEANSNWDLTSTNWFSDPLDGTYPRTHFLQGDLVTFDDIGVPTNFPGVASSNVNIGITVTPSTLTVNNGSVEYTFVGSGKISGDVALSKQGSGALNLFTANDYTGGTTIGGSSFLVITNDSALGDSSSAVTVNGTLVVTNGAQVSSTRTFSANGTGSDPKFDIGSGASLTIGGTLDLTSSSGTTVLNKNGEGTLILDDDVVGTPELNRLQGNSGELWIRGNVHVAQGNTPMASAGPDLTSTIILDGGSLNVRDPGNPTATPKNVELSNGGGMTTMIITNNATAEFWRIYLGDGTVSVNGTTEVHQVSGVVTAQTLVLGPRNANGNTANKGVYRLDGGRLIAGNIRADDVAAITELYINNATLEAYEGAVILDDTVDLVDIGASGFTLDTATFNAQVQTPISGSGGLILTGTGELELQTNMTYVGATVVSGGSLEVWHSMASSSITVQTNGELRGFGTIAGPVSIEAGGGLTPSPDNNGLEVLTINNTLTLNGQVNMQLDRTNTPSNDRITGVTTLNYGGTLNVNNDGESLQLGDTFQLFSAGTPVGDFATLNLPALDPGLGWSWDPATGTLEVIAGGTPPTFDPPSVVGGELILTGTGGVDGNAYVLLGSTNITTPLAIWTPVLTNTFGAGGSFSNAIPVSPGQPMEFFIIQLP